jgi:hypothetical protein
MIQLRKSKRETVDEDENVVQDPRGYVKSEVQLA